MTKQHLLGISALVSSAFLYGFFAIFTRSVGFELPLFFASFSRNVIGMIFLCIPFLVWGRWKKVKRKDVKWLFLRGLGGLVGFVGSYLAFYNMGIGITYFLFYASTAISGYLFGSLFFGEKITAFKILSLLMAFFGLAFIYSFSPKDINITFSIYAVLSGIGSAVWNISSKKISHAYSSFQLNIIDFGFSLCFALFLSLLFRESWTVPSLSPLWIMNILFAFMFVVTGQLMIYGFKYVEAQTGTLIMLTEVVFGIILGYIFYRETLGWSAIVGGVFIVSAIVLPEVLGLKKTAKNKI